jgi:integrase/recombinase XerD
LVLAGASAGAQIKVLFEEFFVARKPLKGSPHTEAAYRGDLAAILAQLEADLGTETDQLRLGQVTAKSLRRAFAAYSDNHAAASIARAWAAWNQFFGFLVADEVVVGNPMAAVAKPKVPARAPKALQGEGTPERLLEAVAAGERQARNPWPERDLAFIATALLTGLRLSELLNLDLGSIDGREGERRLKVIGKGSKVRIVPIEAPLELVITHYLSTRKAHDPKGRLASTSPHFVHGLGERLQRGGAQYLVRQSYRWAGVGARVPKGALVHVLRHTMATRPVKSAMLRQLHHSTCSAIKVL